MKEFFFSMDDLFHIGLVGLREDMDTELTVLLW